MATENTVMAVIRVARPSFRNAHDKVAFAVHATFLASGYTLTATGPRAFSDDSLSSSSSDEVRIEGWKETDDSYGFVYSNKDNGSSITVLVKCLVMGDHLVIDALCSRDQTRNLAVLRSMSTTTMEEIPVQTMQINIKILQSL